MAKIRYGVDGLLNYGDGNEPKFEWLVSTNDLDSAKKCFAEFNVDSFMSCLRLVKKDGKNKTVLAQKDSGGIVWVA